MKWQRRRTKFYWKKSDCENLIISLEKKKIDIVYVKVTSDSAEKLSGYFSESQIRSVLTDKHVIQWHEEDISRAVTLRSLSTKASLHRGKHFAMPSITTIRCWVSKVNIESGVLFPVIQLLQHNAQAMSEFDRLCILSFDETTVLHEWSYDKVTNTLIAPKHKVPCAMITGLAKPWKQLVYYNIGTDMTKDILFLYNCKIRICWIFGSWNGKWSWYY